jgi:hypothetical protein
MPLKGEHVFISVKDDARESQLTIKGDLELLGNFLSTLGKDREVNELKSREKARAKEKTAS